MPPLREHTAVLRSKNAGPYELSLDIIFESQDDYETAKKVDLFDSSDIAELYEVPDEAIHNVIYHDPANAVKITLDRSTVSGNPGDTDVYGAQQYAPLLSLKLP